MVAAGGGGSSDKRAAGGGSGGAGGGFRPTPSDARGLLDPSMTRGDMAMKVPMQDVDAGIIQLHLSMNIGLVQPFSVFIGSGAGFTFSRSPFSAL